MGFEFELKYAATPGQLQAITRHFAGDFETITMETTYLDTKNRDLSARHYSLRSRLENGICIYNLKIPLNDHARGEWECRADSMEQAAKILSEMAGDAALIPSAPGELMPICGARFTRLAKTLALPDCTVELALDAGALMGGGRTEPLCEVEVELKSGSADAAEAFAAELARTFSLSPESRSKFARARALEDLHGI